mmetsp:Transcript_33187/g.55640  ORF Transcript_33187/g.55640 Transcript_33187/m.55640 type:complete len:428 (+) Transcript_33187:100-1383(+)|eukprot:CAMPEP_0198224904 /NCGR_PEP_ID=MMETSP1445-20131203/98766_1 /TAXON_ID=36898 /ORGANISM="Pyramimonas sp., Strain CCMP2087" /LENGTH=427 /DNA_ID=CAMNT_0043904221 /DNA_START=24 /DNA_END=1307 /DNA_ORIENTATION=-
MGNQSGEVPSEGRVAPQVEMRGQLWKRSDILKQWKPRYFFFGSMRTGQGTLIPVLVYKQRESDKQARGHIPLNGSVGLLPRGEAHPTYTCFYINVQKKSYVLGAENLADAQAWVAAILSTVRASIAADTGLSRSCLAGSEQQQAGTSVSHSAEVQEAALTVTTLATASGADKPEKETQRQLAKARMHSAEVRGFTPLALAGALVIALDAPLAGLFAAFSIGHQYFRTTNKVRPSTSTLHTQELNDSNERDQHEPVATTSGNTLEEKCSQQEKRIRELLGESELKEQMLVECRDELEAVRQELNAATQARRTSTQRIEQLEGHVSTMDEKFSDTEAKIGTLQATVQSETERRASAETKLRAIEGKSESLKQQLDAAEASLLRPFDMWQQSFSGLRKSTLEYPEGLDASSGSATEKAPPVDFSHMVHTP